MAKPLRLLRRRDDNASHEARVGSLGGSSLGGWVLLGRIDLRPAVIASLRRRAAPAVNAAVVREN
jgi:hypothetical protein